MNDGNSIKIILEDKSIIDVLGSGGDFGSEQGLSYNGERTDASQEF